MDLAAKLQIKPGYTVAILNPPDAFALSDVVAHEASDAEAVIGFAVQRADLARLGALLDAARDDRLAWIGYPKGGPLGTDLNRDILAEALKTDGVRPVRQVSIDQIWSALWIRPAT